uniref:Uncharacterized protein n=1 Tax=Anguilla anguilla TaxID=7936 RepID=A0A0E9SPM6_ANGAN
MRVLSDIREMCGKLTREQLISVIVLFCGMSRYSYFLPVALCILWLLSVWSRSCIYLYVSA